ncbi:replication protein A 70 kDa DNA-binding subunit B [Tanacetum coccineum]
MFRFEPLIQEGQCYAISNFSIAEKSGKLPLLPHKYKISFYKGMVVTRIDSFDNNVNGFILEPFNRLLDGTRQYHEHEAVGTLLIHNALFGNKMFINRDLPEILSFRIYRIHKENGWAYTACKECNKKVNVVESKAMSSAGKSKVTFYCEDHGAVQYKVIMRIIDQSGSAPIVFFNTMINKLSGYTTWELMEKHGMDVDEYCPGELLDLVGKRGEKVSGSKRVFIDLDDIDSNEDEEVRANKTPKMLTVKVEKEDP